MRLTLGGRGIFIVRNKFKKHCQDKGIEYDVTGQLFDAAISHEEFLVNTPWDEETFDTFCREMLPDPKDRKKFGAAIDKMLKCFLDNQKAFWKLMFVWECFVEFEMFARMSSDDSNRQKIVRNFLSSPENFRRLIFPAKILAEFIEKCSKYHKDNEKLIMNFVLSNPEILKEFIGLKRNLVQFFECFSKYKEDVVNSVLKNFGSYFLGLDSLKEFCEALSDKKLEEVVMRYFLDPAHDAGFRRMIVEQEESVNLLIKAFCDHRYFPEYKQDAIKVVLSNKEFFTRIISNASNLQTACHFFAGQDSKLRAELQAKFYEYQQQPAMTSIVA